MKLLLFILIVSPIVAFSTIIEVNLDGTGDFTEIQAGIDSASENDTILVFPGTYYENVCLNGIDIKLLSLYQSTLNSLYITDTIIHGDGFSSTLTIDTSETEETVVSGFTITNEECSFFYGGGIYCSGTDPVLSDLIITNMNFPIWGSGGGIYLFNSGALIRNVIVSDNLSTYGGGIYAEYSNPEIIDVKFENNSAFRGGAICYLQSDFVIINSLFTNNYSSYDGGGIWCDRSDGSILNSTFANNNGTLFGGAVWCIWSTDIILYNCIMFNDLPEEICFTDDSYYPHNSITIFHSDIEGGEEGIVTYGNGSVNWMGGNIDEDPQFIDQGINPYSLQTGSPCIDCGTLQIGSLDLPEHDIMGNSRIYGEMVDMGAYEWQGVEASDHVVDVEVCLTCYPNPFNPNTTIDYSISQDSDINLTVYNLKGQKIKTLVHGYTESGNHSVTWDGTDENGNQVGSGVYLYKLEVDGRTQAVKKMVLVK